MRTITAMLVLSLFGCDGVSKPEPEDCTEFTYNTTHSGQQVSCRMLWCNRGNFGESHMGSGMAVLWCDPSAK